MADFEPRVLVVDDERFFREAIREALASAGIDCEIAEDARSALAAASEASFAVAVVDVGLPESGGIEVLKGLRDRDPTTRVIVLSAPSEQDAVLDALRLDATDYLAKPLHDEELVLAVRRALSGHAIETRFAALRDRICDLDARAAALVASANDAPAGGPFPRSVPRSPKLRRRCSARARRRCW
jgi:DNA-binding response OmpR family regulator